MSMGETIKVSIGGISFSVTKDAYERLRDYLNSIEKHYKGKLDGQEIINDIESRIAELLLEKNKIDEVVDLQRAEVVIDIMGVPTQFSEEEAENLNRGSETGPQESFKEETKPLNKRLYRDRSDRLIGGVCSGLAHYFKFDVTILRIILVAIFMLSFIGRRSSIFDIEPLVFGLHFMRLVWRVLVLGYIILWILVPSAKTYMQRCQMKGVHPGIQGAEDYVTKSQGKRGSVLGRIFKVFIGLVFLSLGMGLVTIFSWCLIIQPNTFLGAFIGSAEIVFAFLALLIPSIAFLYTGIVLTFNINWPKFKIGLLLFILWLLSLLGLIVAGSNRVHKIAEHHKTYTEVESFPKYYDTMYVEYEPLPEYVGGETVEWETLTDKIAGVVNSKGFKKWRITWNGRQIGTTEEEGEHTVTCDDSYSRSEFYVSKGRKQKRVYAYYPSLRIFHKSSATIEMDTTASEESVMRRIKDTTVVADMQITETQLLSKPKNEQEERESQIEVRDSLIIMRPKIFTKKMKFRGEVLSAKLNLPDSSVVIIKSPKYK